MTDKFNFVEYADETDYATYNPDDNKVRIYCGRVSRELYDALKGLGFGRAPKQGCFFQVWSPAREDAALALCGEIGDEDSTLFDRAEERSARFATYSGNAERRAEQAIKAGDDAVGGIPFGQPILVGHHSERKHRKAVERAQAAADRTVQEFDRRDYWAYRARAVKRHAERTFDRGVVLRRVKKLEAERRGYERDKTPTDLDWSRIKIIEKLFGYSMFDEYELTDEQAAQVEARLEQGLQANIKRCDRWIDHLDGQIAYWKAVLEDEHGIDVDDQLPLARGGWVRSAYGWGKVVRVNKGAEGRISSVSVDKATFKHERPRSGWFPRVVDYDRILEWSESEPEAEIRVDPTPHATLQEPDPLRQEAEERAAALKAVEVKVNWDPDYFPTPPDVVDLMLNEVADVLGDGRRMLEPSAGDGRIIEAVLRRYGEPLPDRGVTPFWCEVNSTAIETLRAKGLGGLQLGTDFFEVEPNPSFDAVVMNPPFGNRAYVKHVMHAWEFLKPGGMLVTVLPGEARYHNDEDNDRFRRWAEDKHAGHIDLGFSAFKDAGTNISAHVLVLRKPNGDYEQGRLL